MDYKVIIDNSGNSETLTDYQVKVTVTDPVFFSKCTEQKFVEFYDEDMVTLLNHWTEKFDTVNNVAIFWVKIPNIPANGIKTIYLNINTSRTEDLSNGENVFEFFDDFEGSALDTNKWNLVKGTEGSNVFVLDSMLKVTSNSVLIQSKQSFSQGFILECKNKWKSPIQYGYIVQGFRETTSKDAEHLIHDEGNRLYTDGSATGYPFIPQGEVWYLYRLKVKDNTAKAEIHEILADGSLSLKSSLEGTTTFTNAVITLVERPDTYEARSVEAYWDWIRIRKYTEPEPTVAVIPIGTTPTLEFKKRVAECIITENCKINEADPELELYDSNGTLIKSLPLADKHKFKDTENNRVVVQFLFVDNSNDSYTSVSQKLKFTKNGNKYTAFEAGETIEKSTDEPLPLRWEIYIPYTLDIELEGEY